MAVVDQTSCPAAASQTARPHCLAIPRPGCTVEHRKHPFEEYTCLLWSKSSVPPPRDKTRDPLDGSLPANGRCQLCLSLLPGWRDICSLALLPPAPLLTKGQSVCLYLCRVKQHLAGSQAPGCRDAPRSAPPRHLQLLVLTTAMPTPQNILSPLLDFKHSIHLLFALVNFCLYHPPQAVLWDTIGNNAVGRTDVPPALCTFYPSGKQ